MPCAEVLPHGVGAHGWVARICQPWEQSSSRSWLPIVEAPGCFRHPTSILAMQLLNGVKCNLTELTTKRACVPLEVNGVDTFAHASEFHVLVDCVAAESIGKFQSL